MPGPPPTITDLIAELMMDKKNEPKVFSKDIKDLRMSLCIEAVHDPLAVTVVAIHENPAVNRNTPIPCHHGIPIGGYVYNSVDDTISVPCVGYCHLGLIQISYLVSMQTAASWHMRVPLPESVIKRYLTPHQKRRLFQFKKTDFKGEVTFQYVQTLGAF